MDHISSAFLEKAISYAEYRELASTLLADGHSTAHLSPVPGVAEGPEILEYTRMNEQRMNRIDKTIRIPAETAAQLQLIDRPLLWLTLTESWCGDAAQIIPVLNALASNNPHLQLRFLLRDVNLELTDAFLTNGGRAIPKVIMVDPETNRVLGSWGPRPAEAQDLYTGYKQQINALADQEAKAALWQVATTALHTWYAKDKGLSTMQEVIQASIAALQAPQGAVLV